MFLKKLVVVLLTISVSCSVAFAQTEEVRNAEYYLESSIKKRKTAKNMLIFGATGVVVGSGLLTYVLYYDGSSHGSDVIDPLTLGAVGATGVTLIGGGLLSLGSIPVFIVSKKHKEKAILLEPTINTTRIRIPNVNPNIATAGVRLRF
ncbi:hypothetical protein [Sphingobacterium hungaricum]|uniref:Uncharacterized protein n=1 Tax=Sphingobacterium hungaricum TaxID=2082723 RepID=A0A928UXB6_9SPHI|nr:hypothetical protein [Sphingobacterium hungaricum]MBE8714955.1 hypothetical protein [Sphingobacterium hungaricum]